MKSSKQKKSLHVLLSCSPNNQHHGQRSWQTIHLSFPGKAETTANLFQIIECRNSIKENDEGAEYSCQTWSIVDHRVMPQYNLVKALLTAYSFISLVEMIINVGMLDSWFSLDHLQ